jgi:hypothetical protein
MRRGGYRDNLAGGGSWSSADEVMDGDEESGGPKATTPPSEPEPVADVKGKGKEKEVVNGSGNGNGTARKFFGFDEDDEFMSSDDEASDGEDAKA